MNLSLIPTEDILKELEGRFDHMFFYGLKEKVGSIGSDNVEGTYWFSGDTNIIMGLCERLKYYILYKEPQRGSYD
jgi:hypothetical protein